MGKQTGETLNEFSLKPAPKIVKLKFQFGKKSEIQPSQNSNKKEPQISEKRTEVFENFKVGDAVFQLSKPKHQLLKEADPIDLVSNYEISKTELASSKGQKNEVTQEQLMNLDKDELKYLKRIVLNKHKDIDAEKHHRSRQRYGW